MVLVSRRSVAALVLLGFHTGAASHPGLDMLLRAIDTVEGQAQRTPLESDSLQIRTDPAQTSPSHSLRYHQNYPNAEARDGTSYARRRQRMSVLSEADKERSKERSRRYNVDYRARFRQWHATKMEALWAEIHALRMEQLGSAEATRMAADSATLSEHGSRISNTSPQQRQLQDPHTATNTARLEWAMREVSKPRKEWYKQWSREKKALAGSSSAQVEASGRSSNGT